MALRIILVLLLFCCPAFADDIVNSGGIFNKGCQVQYNGVAQNTNCRVLNFTGSGVTVTPDTAKTTIVITGGGGGGSGSVTSIATSNGITGGPITTAGTISGINALADGSTKGVSAYTASDFDSSSGLISIDYTNGQAASSSLKGFLTSADWSTFNGKQAAGNYITALTGDVTAAGPGSVAATIATGAVTDTKASLANKPAVTVVATSNQTLSGAATIDGQLTVAGTSIALLTAQSSGSENGPWVVQAGAWTRPTWYPSGGTTQAFPFITTFVRLGTVYQGSTWRMTTSGAITIDTTATTWMVTPLAFNSSTINAFTSATLASILSDETGSGLAVFSDSPTFTTFLKLPNGANPTVDAAGKIAIDTSATTGSAIRFYGDATYTLPAWQSKGFILDTPTTASNYNMPIWPQNITIQQIKILTVGPSGSTLTGAFSNCNSNGLSCTQIGMSITATADTSQSDNGALTNTALTAGNVLRWNTSAVSGAVTSDTITWFYTFDAVN